MHMNCTPPPVQIVQAVVTTYGPTGQRNRDGRPYGGDRIAADQRLYPAGTILRLTWQHKSILCDVSDTGSAVHGQHFDVPIIKMSHWIGVSRRRAATTTLHGVRVHVVRRGRPQRRRHHGR